MIRAILAADSEWGIGKNNSLPWPHNEDDQKWFKEMTQYHTIVMGRKTWESLPIKPLPNRENIVVTSIDKIKGCSTLSIDNPPFKFIYKLRKLNSVWIIGGAQLIKTLIREIDELYVSRIEGNWDCDSFLPCDVIEQRFSKVVIPHKTLHIEKWIS